jgi:hypothetical protein
MTGPHRRETQQAAPSAANGHEGHRGHGWLMIACCIPMLAIAVALVATGVAGAGFLIVAVACTAMMALMMRGMHRGDAAHGHGDDRGPTGSGRDTVGG